MLKDHADKYYFEGNYNCAETVMHAANEYYGLGLADREIKLLGGYGAGMQTGNICGALLAGISVLTCKYVEVKAHESADIGPVTAMLIDRFKAEIGETLLCADIKAMNFAEGQRCRKTVQAACDVLEKVLEEYQPV